MYLLRRMPFILEGFQPTLSGVLAACLVGLALGSAFGTPLLARLFRDRAPEASVLLAALVVAVGLTEHAAPAAAMGMLPIETTFGLHARIWVAAGIAAIPVCLLLGATVPLCIAEFNDPGERSAAAGRLFFWQGVGSIAGSLTVSQLLTRAFPEGFFVWTPFLLGLVPLAFLLSRVPRKWALAHALAVTAAAFAGLSGIGTLLSPEPPLTRPGYHQAQEFVHLAHRTDSGVTASASWDPDSRQMLLYTNEFAAAARGAAGDYMKVLGHLPFLLRDDLRHVAVIAFGTGTTARSVSEWSTPETIDLVEISRAVIDVSGYFAAEGPLYEPRTPRFLEDPRTTVRLADGRRYLAEREPGSLDLVTMEPLLAYSPGTTSLYTREFYALASRALSDDGLLVQWIPTHALPRAYYESLVATFVRSFEHHSVWILDGQTLLVGGQRPHLPTRDEFERRFGSASRAASVSMHEALLASWDDFRLLFGGEAAGQVVAKAPDVTDDRPFTERLGLWKYDGSARHFLSQNYVSVLEPLATIEGEGAYHEDGATKARLHRTRSYRLALQPLPATGRSVAARRAVREIEQARALFPRSTRIHGQETFARRRWLLVVFFQGNGRGDSSLAAGHVERDPGSAFMQALMGSLGLTSAREAAAHADAVQPDWTRMAPPYMASIASFSKHESPLFDIADLPQGEDLVAAATGESPTAYAMRGAYSVRVARAYVDTLARRALSEEEIAGLRRVLDPASLRLAEAAIRARGGDPVAELAAAVRSDLREGSSDGSAF